MPEKDIGQQTEMPQETQLALEDEILARRGEWTTLARRIHERIQEAGYNGRTFTGELTDLLDALAQYREVVAVGMTFVPNIALKPSLTIWNLTSDPKEGLTPLIVDRSKTPIDVLAVCLRDTIEVIPRIIEQRYHPSILNLHEHIGRETQRTFVGTVVAVFPTSLSNI